MAENASGFRAGNVGAVGCGHDAERKARGRPRELCDRCQLSANLALRLRQAAQLAELLDFEIDAAWLRDRARVADPRGRSEKNAKGGTN